MTDKKPRAIYTSSRRSRRRRDADVWLFGLLFVAAVVMLAIGGIWLLDSG
jgi:hypothetical protein